MYRITSTVSNVTFIEIYFISFPAIPILTNTIDMHISNLYCKINKVLILNFAFN